MKPRQTPDAWECRLAWPSEWTLTLQYWHDQLKGTELLDVHDFQLKQDTYPAQGLWIATLNERIDAILWLWPESGGYAHVWPMRVNPDLQSDLRENCAKQLWVSAAAHYQLAGTKLFQTLIPVSHADNLAQMKQLGFTQIAQIERHQLSEAAKCSLNDFKVIHLEPYDVSRQSTFNEIMQESFTGSLDVPELNAIQLTDDVNSHDFDSSYDRYFISHESRGIVGVIVTQSAGEVGLLRYVGLIPSARHEGYARYALEQAIILLRSQGCMTIELRVDERNEPAIRLYRGLGFTVIGKEQMLIYR